MNACFSMPIGGAWDFTFFEARIAAQIIKRVGCALW